MVDAIELFETAQKFLTSHPSFIIDLRPSGWYLMNNYDRSRVYNNSRLEYQGVTTDFAYYSPDHINQISQSIPTGDYQGTRTTLALHQYPSCPTIIECWIEQFDGSKTQAGPFFKADTPRMFLTHERKVAETIAKAPETPLHYEMFYSEEKLIGLEIIRRDSRFDYGRICASNKHEMWGKQMIPSFDYLIGYAQYYWINKLDREKAHHYQFYVNTKAPRPEEKYPIVGESIKIKGITIPTTIDVDSLAKTILEHSGMKS